MRLSVFLDPQVRAIETLAREVLPALQGARHAR
jgi:hypothetical protein